ncbi:hypothetical protein [Candidatus Uabimicrobium sp. HlEnr_7]|uniref:hypothetical protein n=1 Tax=Candidatus Uabimicrobium helgolandensis TaxID=3095367 RepID=UPI003558477C
MNNIILAFTLSFFATIMADEVQSWYNIYSRDNGDKIGYVHHKILFNKDHIQQNENVYIFRYPQKEHVLFIAVTEIMEKNMQMRSKKFVQYRQGQKTVKSAFVKGDFIEFFAEGKPTVKVIKPKIVYGNLGGRVIKHLGKLREKTKEQLFMAQDQKVVAVQFEISSKKNIQINQETISVFPIKFSAKGEDFSGETYVNDEGHDLVFIMENPRLRWEITSEKNAKSKINK